MKKLLSALACGVLLMCGGMSTARADYYEMYNPATHVEGGAMVYETTRGTLMSLKVHSGEWQEDHYRAETEASGVVRFAHDGERFIGYLHVPSLASYEMVWVILLGTDIVCRFMKSMLWLVRRAIKRKPSFTVSGFWVSLRVMNGCSLHWQVLMKEATKEVRALCRVKRKCLGM